MKSRALDLERTRAPMDRVLETALLTDVPPLAAAITLPDEEDRHVLVAALHAGAVRAGRLRLRAPPFTAQT